MPPTNHSNRVCTDFVYGVYLAICDEGASIMTVHASGRAQFTNTMNMSYHYSLTVNLCALCHASRSELCCG